MITVLTTLEKWVILGYFTFKGYGWIFSNDLFVGNHQNVALRALAVWVSHWQYKKSTSWMFSCRMMSHSLLTTSQFTITTTLVAADGAQKHQ